MRKLKYLYILSLFILACTNEIPLDTTAIQPRIVMNGIFDSHLDTNYIRLHWTGSSEVNEIKDAKVMLYKNGEMCEESLYKKGGYPFTTTFDEEDQLRFECNYQNIQVYSDVKVLKRVEILSVDTFSVMTTASSDETTPSAYLQVKIRIRDIPGEKNYYRLQAERIDSLFPNHGDVYTEHFSDLLIKSDAVLSEGYDNGNGNNGGSSDVITYAPTNYTGIFQDSYFQDSEVTLTFYLRKWSVGGFDIRRLHSIYSFKVLNVTALEYVYMRVLNLHKSDIYVDGLYDPLIFPSNVRGGTGFVCANLSDTYIYENLTWEDDDENLYTDH